MKELSIQRVIKRVVKGIKYALEGFQFALKEDEHFRINLTLSLTGVFLSLILLSGCERILVALINYLVLVLESVNTAIERAVDTATSEFHPLAKASKDLAATAVLLIGVFALLIDLIYLLPKIAEILCLEK